MTNEKALEHTNTHPVNQWSLEKINFKPKAIDENDIKVIYLLGHYKSSTALLYQTNQAIIL